MSLRELHKRQDQGLPDLPALHEPPHVPGRASVTPRGITLTVALRDCRVAELIHTTADIPADLGGDWEMSEADFVRAMMLLSSHEADICNAAGLSFHPRDDVAVLTLLTQAASDHVDSLFSASLQRNFTVDPPEAVETRRHVLDDTLRVARAALTIARAALRKAQQYDPTYRGENVL